MVVYTHPLVEAGQEKGQGQQTEIGQLREEDPRVQGCPTGSSSCKMKNLCRSYFLRVLMVWVVETGQPVQGHGHRDRGHSVPQGHLLQGQDTWHIK